MWFSGFSLLLVALSLRFGANQVVEWSDEQFDSGLVGSSDAFVMFFAPWCGHCKKLKPVWDVLGADPSVSKYATIAKVDCTDKGKKLCEKHSVSGYPTIKYLSWKSGSEKAIPYDGDRDIGSLRKFVLDNGRPAFKVVSDDEVEEFVKSNELPVILGVFKGEDSKLFKKLSELAESFKKSYQIGYTFSKEAAKKLDLKPDSVVVFRQRHLQTKLLDDHLLSETAVDKLEHLMENNRYSLVDVRKPSNEDDFSPPLVVVFLSSDPVLHKSTFKQFRNKVVKVAKSHKETKFAISSHHDYETFLNEIRPYTDAHYIFIVGYGADKKRYVCNVTTSTKDSKSFSDVLETFVENFLKGGYYEPYIRSQAPPKLNNEPVKVVVGSTFEEIVLDEEKDVLIEFYAPWCGHCKKLEPVYKQLGELLQDEKHLVIAKIDATANEYPSQFPVSGYPTILFSKVGHKSSPVVFDGDRSLKGMVEWLKAHSSSPIKFDGPFPDVKEEL